MFLCFFACLPALPGTDRPSHASKSQVTAGLTKKTLRHTFELMVSMEPAMRVHAGTTHAITLRVNYHGQRPHLLTP